MSLPNIINKNFLLHAAKLPSLTRGMMKADSKNLTYVDCGLSCDTFNIISITNGELLSTRELADATDYFQKNNRAFCIWINEENLTSTVREILNTLHLCEAGDQPGMALDLLEDELKPDFTGDIRRVTTTEQMNDAAIILSLNWSPPDLNVVRFFQETAEAIVHSDLTEFFIFYYEQQPVSVIEIFPTDNETAGIYNLSTIETFRKKGIGTNLLKFALNRLKQKGCSRVILQASSDGLAIYQRHGFKTVTKFYEFKSENFL